MTESAKNVAQPLERKRAVPFDTLLDQVAAGERSDDALLSLAGRLAALAGRLPAQDQAEVVRLAGEDLHGLSRRLLAATDADAVEEEARRRAMRANGRLTQSRPS